ncbi:MAG: carbonic anhydrase [Alphaproteobacteria bacterium]
MVVPTSLAAGYLRFRRRRYARERQLYAELAEGQSPRLAVLACADSRVDPAMIFDARPGELFVLRNVANLVPDYEADGGFHSTSAGLEYAVRHLAVDDIVVMGHAACGGIDACVHHFTDGAAAGRFIDPWVGLAGDAFRKVRERHPELAGHDLQHEVELESIRCSLKRLSAFPFVVDALEDRRLRLHGAWFSIASGEMLWLDQDNGAFHAVTARALAKGHVA